MAVAMQTEDFPYLPSGLAEVNKMIKEHGDLFSDSQCKICSAVLNSDSQKLTHYQSKKHANKVRRYLSIQNDKEPALKIFKSSASDSECNNGDTERSKVCHVCNMTFSSPVEAESHYNGKVHTKNLRLKTIGPRNPVPSQTPVTVQPKKKPAEDPSNRFCSICHACFNNPLMAQQHYVGKKHRKQMTKLKLMETYGPSTAPASTLKGYPCTVCSIELNSVAQYQSHISGAKHKNQVKKSGVNPAENQEPAEPSFDGEVQYNDGENDGENLFTVTEDQFPPAEDTEFAVEDTQYAPEDTEYSEAYQFT
ncbi:Zinc finger protein 346 [Dissostichus eleginoides]|uniref:Zinc finger protein 346 n=1 Tax=Dissostichus eleginoides TaxID=100907 RepID=A0AAD9BGL7_DISEL|nr:Zinc finger protein 346 [Dissostichus eleginoides]